MSVPRRFRPLAVVLYAAFVGLLLASYISPLDGIISGRADASALEQQLEEAHAHNTEQQRLKEDLNTPAGIERAARERYGMIRPGEKVYIVE
ncbi:MAG: septum formation initiator family protein [Rubrobacter sp.]|jgi:cell division protein FtsB|nr:septum formation initiator family protein [Rubrobacter sp.]MDQ3361849.1 septum formation initiator family protein [Actinomycetota bacterium]MDQ3376302.1 septum formation initiator family protein [Actinomycetota bacterium]